jgi:hypothetical protein
MGFPTVQNLKMPSAGKMRLIEPPKTEEGAINFNIQTCIFILQRFGFSAQFWALQNSLLRSVSKLVCNIVAESVVKVRNRETYKINHWRDLADKFTRLICA